MSIPIYRVVSSKTLDNGNIQVQVVTESGKRCQRTIRPSEGGGLLTYHSDVTLGLELVVMETCAPCNGLLLGLYFYVSEQATLREIIKLARTLPHLSPVREQLHAQPEHIENAAD